MSIKYKIDDAKKNKNLINDEIKLSRIKSNGNHGDGKIKPPKSKMPSWFKEFSIDINKRFDKQEEFNTRIEKQVSNLRNGLSNLKSDLSGFKNDLSTLKNDLSALKNDLSNLNNRFDNLVEVNNLKE